MMKKFIKLFFIFVIPIVVSSYFIDVFISNHLKKSNKDAFGEYTTWNDLLEGKVNSDIVIYGSSRAWRHFSPQIITDRLHLSAYNLGMDGHNFWLQYLRHTTLIKNNTKPKLIICSLDVFTLQKNKDLYNSEQFLPYMLGNKDIEYATKSYNGFNWFDYKIPLVRYYGKYFEIIKTAYLSINPSANKIKRVRGYQRKDELWNSDFDRAKLKMKKYEIQLDSKTLVLFETFLKECKANNIKLVFVYTPEYIEGQKFVKNRGQIMGLYKKFSRDYQIPFYDYSNDSISYQKKYFYNATHLNKYGSELFTKKITDTLKESAILKKLNH